MNPRDLLAELIARGTGGGKSLMLNGHIDTVSTAGYDGDALKPVTGDGKMFGRGTFDMKGGRHRGWWTYRIVGTNPDTHGIYYGDPADPAGWILKRAWLDLVNGYLAA